jgi:hypothetical protein
MTAPYGAGDVVECVNDQGHVGDVIRVGDRYVVSGFKALDHGQICTFDDCGLDGVLLEGLEKHNCRLGTSCFHHGLLQAFCPNRFRPIYRRTIGAFDHMLVGDDVERPLELVP